MPATRLEASRKVLSPRLIKRIIVFSCSLCLLLIVSLLSIRYGSINYAVSEIMGAISTAETSTVRTVIMNIRLPRTLIAVMVGANLAMSGALLQSVMRNPLADPGLTGVSAGAGLAAVTIMLALPQLTRFVPVAAFLGGIIAAFMVYLLAWKRGVDPIRIILAGVAVNAILGGGLALLSVLYSDRIQSVIMWLNGTVAGKSWYQVETLIPYSLIGLIAAMLCINTANVLQLGDDAAKNLGIRVNVWQRFCQSRQGCPAARRNEGKGKNSAAPG